MSLVNGIHHVSMKCCNQEEYRKVLHFYHEILGLSITHEWETGFMMDSGNVQIEIFTNGKEQMPKGVISHIAFATDDVEKCIEAIRQAGYEVFIEPKDIDLNHYYVKIAFCYGPLGEEIEFFEEKKTNE